MSNQLSDSRISEIRDRLNNLMNNDSSLSNSIVGKNIGYSAGYVSMFCNNKFPAPSKEAEFADKVESFILNLTSSQASAISKGHLKFAMTAAAEEIFKTAYYASTDHKIGLVIGVPGCGKTISVQEYVRRNPNSVLIEVPPFVTQRSFLQDVCTALKIPIYDTRRNNDSSIPSTILFRQVVEKLMGTNRTLMADEGEKLTTGCIEIIRRIHDFTGVGVLLSGTEVLLDRIQGPRRELKQLYSRVGMLTKIELLKEGDVKAILQLNFPEGLKYTKNFLQLSKNNGRTLEQLVDLVKKDIKETGETLTEETIDIAAESLIR